MPTDDFQPMNDPVIAGCMLNLDDQIAVVAAAENGVPTGVMVEACQELTDGGMSGAQLLLGPADARRIAAALLNCADMVDGTVPLVFYERPPEVGE